MRNSIISSRYRLEQQIGSGGMGTVWVGFDTQLRRQIAVKLTRTDHGNLPIIRTLFAQEARAVAQLQHPNVVQIHDFGIDSSSDGDLPYIIMELLSGEDLETRLRRHRRLAKAMVGSLMNQAARALNTAHAVGLIHRDLKPANLFLARTDGGEVLKILDFGVAAILNHGDATAAGGAGYLCGTPQYMSPEQLRDPSSVDHRSDLYSLAVVAYEALTGQLPFSVQSVEELLTRLYDETGGITPPSQILPELGQATDEFFTRALHREPRQRFQSARELAAAFAALDEAGPSSVTVLVVDDEPDVAVLVRHRLRQKIRRGTYEFLFASDGVSALEELRRHPRIDLVLSDLNMPGMDGLTLLERINEQYPALKTVVVSAYGDMRNIREAMNRGAFDFLTKPIDFLDLERTIDKAAQYVRSLRRSIEWAEENALLRTLVSSSLLDRLMPAVAGAGATPGNAAGATVAVINLRRSQEAQPGQSSEPGDPWPDSLVHGLNCAFDKVAPEIVQRGGTLERFLGNNALVVFRDTDHAARALDACLAVSARFELFRQGALANFRVGIAVDAGWVLYASVGAPSLRRMEYTVLGQPVSNALSLQTLAANEQILVTSELVQQVADKFDFQRRGSYVPPGEAAGCPIFRLVGRRLAPGSEPVQVGDLTAAPQNALDDTLFPGSSGPPSTRVAGVKSQRS